jgi:MFS family permease
VSLRRAEAGAAPVAAVILPFAAGYFLSYFFRSVNAVISPDLVAEFSLSAAQLGLLTAAYFLAFAAFQIPLGLLLDRFGPRRTNSALLVVAGSGALLFGVAENTATLLAGRALIGLGVSGCLMSSIKAFTIWFPIEQLPSRVGWVMFAGGLGALVATAPVEAALTLTDWRGVFITLGCASFAASAAIFLLVPEREAGARAETLAQQVSGLAGIFGSATFWKVAAASTLFQALNMAIQGLWAAPWLADVARLERAGVAMNLLALGAATMCGFLFWGAAAARLARRGIPPMSVFVFATGLFLCVQLLLVIGVTAVPTLLWTAFGFFGTSGSLAFTVLSRSFPAALTGRANTALNLLVFLAAFAAQWLFGAIVDLWPDPSGGYLAEGYSAAFGFFFVLEMGAFVWLLRASPIGAGPRGDLR